MGLEFVPRNIASHPQQTTRRTSIARGELGLSRLVRLPNAAAANYELVCSSLRASWHVVGSVQYLYRAAYLHLRPSVE